MAVGALPFTAIVEYYQIYPLGEFQDFHWIMRRMDSTFLELQGKKKPKDSIDTKGKETNGKGNPGKRNKN